jgi:phytoene dehydrogenase-like protein
MATRFAEFGGIIQSGAAVNSIEREGRNGLTISLASGQKVDASAVATTEDIASRLKNLESAASNNRVPSGDRFYPVRFYIGLDENYVPEGMEDNLFMLREDDGGPLKLKALYLSLTPSGSEMAPEGKRALTVTALAERSRFTSLTDEFIKLACDDLLQALLNVIPFLDEGMDHFDHELATGGSMKMPRPLGGGFVAWNPGMMGRSRITTALKGRAVVMNSSPWELGLEGETISALAAAGALKKVLSRD